MTYRLSIILMNDDTRYVENYVFAWEANCFCGHERITFFFFEFYGAMRSNEGNKRQDNHQVCG